MKAHSIREQQPTLKAGKTYSVAQRNHPNLAEDIAHLRESWQELGTQ
jgi:hypothetical protein